MHQLLGIFLFSFFFVVYGITFFALGYFTCARIYEEKFYKWVEKHREMLDKNKEKEYLTNKELDYLIGPYIKEPRVGMPDIYC